MLIMRVVVGPDRGPMTLFFSISPHVDSGSLGKWIQRVRVAERGLASHPKHPEVHTGWLHSISPLAALHWTGRNRRDLARSKLLGMRYDVSP